MRRAWLIAACTALLALGPPVSAHAAFDDPLFFFTPQPAPKPPHFPPPTGYLDGPCGLATDGFGRFYVSDYYHRAVDIFGFDSTGPTTPSFQGQPLAVGDPINPHTGLLDDPCGLAVDAAGTLYVNNYHRDVVRFPAPASLATGTVIDSGDPLDIYANPTGVAVDPATSRAYVDDRRYVAVYDSSGNPVLSGPNPLRIGQGTLEDGYGIAVSGYPATAGRIYVPDAATDTVEVYDPLISTATPVSAISGPPGGFGSLRDSAIAIDNATGEIYVLDTKGPQYTERPEATVYVFSPTGSYEGRLKHNTVNAAPAGLAVDNSGLSTQGRVYLTSGITENASIYGYPPGAATSAAAAPLSFGGASGGGGGSSVSAAGLSGEASSGAERAATQATTSAISQHGTLRVSVGGKLRPKSLPRKGAAPIAVSVGGQISTTDESLPPSLEELRIDLNRHGLIDYAGLTTCPYDRIQPGSSSHALAACQKALVGKGSFSSDITLAGQEPYPTEGQLLVFNGTSHGKPVLFGHIYSPRPFATSFVIIFKVAKLPHGTYGTSLIAPLPKAMKAWGRLTGLQMTLSRRYSYKGQRHSYLSSGCPAPQGFSKAVFPLARASFAFSGGQRLSSVLSGSCRARG